MKTLQWEDLTVPELLSGMVGGIQYGHLEVDGDSKTVKLFETGEVFKS